VHVALPVTVLYFPTTHAAHGAPSGPVYPALHGCGVGVVVSSEVVVVVVGSGVVLVVGSGVVVVVVGSGVVVVVVGA
jgi:hypothetical protein